MNNQGAICKLLRRVTLNWSCLWYLPFTIIYRVTRLTWPCFLLLWLNWLVQYKPLYQEYSRLVTEFNLNMQIWLGLELKLHVLQGDQLNMAVSFLVPCKRWLKPLYKKKNQVFRRNNPTMQILLVIEHWIEATCNTGWPVKPGRVFLVPR